MAQNPFFDPSVKKKKHEQNIYKMYKNIYIRICGIKKINSAKFVCLSAAINIKQKKSGKKNGIA